MKELVIPPPTNRISPTSASTRESLVVGLATLESVLFSHGKNVMGIQATSFDEVRAVVRWQESVSVV